MLTKVPIIVFAYGDAPADLTPALAPSGVSIRCQGSYEERVAPLVPRAWPTLSQYPLLHKLLNFAEIAALDPDQVLYLDCDTVFFDDVARLFSVRGGRLLCTRGAHVREESLRLRPDLC